MQQTRTSAAGTSLDGGTVALILLTFFLGDLIKGLTGLGLPPIALGILTATIGIQPAKALAPVLVGMSIGNRICKRLCERRFRTVFAVALLLGSYLALSVLSG